MSDDKPLRDFTASVLARAGIPCPEARLDATVADMADLLGKIRLLRGACLPEAEPATTYRLPPDVPDRNG